MRDQPPDDIPTPVRVRRAPLAPPPPILTTPEHEADIAAFAAMYAFPLDDFQVEAIRAFLAGESVLVAAPTGTGKTVVAEFGIWEAFKRTGRVIYTTPIKALSNQKYRDLRTIYGDEVGLLTGDVTENRDARVVVMTTEVLRNMLLQTPWDLDHVDCVIFDEIHYLADPERGTTWEESIILCPDHVQLVCLSATVNNADEIAAWIGRTHRPIRLVTHDQRAVPLALHYFLDGDLHLVVDHTGAKVRDFPHTGGELRRQSAREGGRPRPGERVATTLDEPQPREIVERLAANDMLPAIYFLFSRNDCQAYAERLATMRPSLVTPRQVDLIDQTVEAILAGLRPEDRELEQVKAIVGLARRGIGFHHAGLLPILKQLVEVLFGRGLMEVVFATDTLALGVNMPARTVVVGRMSKWDGRRRRPLIPNEFQQMAGRAGRRGMDSYGHVVVPYSPWFTFRETLDIATGELHPVRSAFAIRYNTVLNLWDPPHGERVRAMLQESLAQFQSAQRIRDLEDESLAIGREIAELPQGCLIGLEGGDDLLEDYRRVIRTVTAAQGKEKRLEADLATARRAVDEASPWDEPGRQALRRAFRTARPGLVAHTPDRGWGVYLGRGRAGGVGRFLFADGSIGLLPEYRRIDHLSDAVVALPEALVEPADDVELASNLVGAPELRAVWDEVATLDLPDLEALAAAHRLRERERAEPEISQLAADLAAARAQVTESVGERQAHPCHACPRRKEHRDLLDQADALERERKGLVEALGREIDAEEERIRGVIRGIRNVLHRFGYLHRGIPTAKADMLAEVFDNDGLILCELVDRGMLDPLPPEELAELFSWFSFDREYRYSNRFVMPDRLFELRRRLADLEHSVLGEERAEGLLISQGHNPNFYGAARAWCLGMSMAEIGARIELSEGDLVLTFNKTIDLMRQVREMLIDTSPGHPLSRTLAEAERMLRRDIVQQSLTIGFAPVVLPDLPPDALLDEPKPARRARRAPTSAEASRGPDETESQSGRKRSSAATAKDEHVPAPKARKPRTSPTTNVSSSTSDAPAGKPARKPRRKPATTAE